MTSEPGNIDRQRIERAQELPGFPAERVEEGELIRDAVEPAFTRPFAETPPWQEKGDLEKLAEGAAPESWRLEMAAGPGTSALQKKKGASRPRRILIIALASVLVLSLAANFLVIRPGVHYDRGLAAMESGDYWTAESEFGKAGNWKDAKEKYADARSAAAKLASDPILQKMDRTVKSDIRAISASSAGDIVLFGGIPWLVLENTGEIALLISQSVLGKRAYAGEFAADVTWEESTLRDYLNRTFYFAFSKADRARILTAFAANADNAEYGTVGGNDTEDRVFLLSIDEANRYFADDAGRIAEDENGRSAWWWLRSPGDRSMCASYVYYDGSIRADGGGISFDFSAGGVRPAVWLKL